MSTKNFHRAKMIALLMLGILSIATIGVLATNQYVPIPNDKEGLEPLVEAIEKGKPNINPSKDSLVHSEIDEIKELKKSSIQKSDRSSISQPNTTTLKNNIANISLPNVNNYKSINVVATGYTAGVESTGKDPSHPEYGITYSGVYVRRDVYSTIAADTHIFPLGTVLYIPGYGYGVVADTGSAIKGYKIDLYFDTVDQVYEEWGKKHVEVYVIKMGDGRVTEEMLNEYNEYAAARTAM